MVKDSYYSLRANELADKEIIDSDQKDSLQAMVSSPDKENTFLTKELIRLKISDALVTGLNQGQVKAFMEIITFLREGTEDGLVLKGYAGTGKTFLMKRVIEYITTAYPNRNIAITAPTNKAVHVLSKNTPFQDKSAIFEEHGQPEAKIVYSTIHKLLGLKEQISNSGVQSFVAGGGKKGPDITKFKYLGLDEVSMLPDDIFEELMKFSDKIKFIFMGDPAQIPPVGKEHCMPFSDKCEYNLKKVELTEIMRQKGEHAIVDYGMILRENLTLQQPLPDLKTKLADEGKGGGVVRFNAVTQRPMIRKMVDILFKDANYSENSDFVKLIAWRNATVAFLNGIVREALYGKDPARYNIGDKLVANKPLFKREQAKMWGGFQYRIKANTSDEFTVTGVKKVYMEFEEHFRNSPTVKFDGYFWKLDVLTMGGHKEVLHVVHEDSAAEYNKTVNDMKVHAMQMRISDYWVMKFNMEKWSDNVVYNYAITAHKSQGSTYDNVILIEEDLDFNKKIVERNRIKYTAYTRASNRLYVLR